MQGGQRCDQSERFRGMHLERNGAPVAVRLPLLDLSEVRGRQLDVLGPAMVLQSSDNTCH